MIVVAKHETNKQISSVGIYFRQSFTKNRLRDIDGQRICHDDTQGVGGCKTN